MPRFRKTQWSKKFNKKRVKGGEWERASFFLVEKFLPLTAKNNPKGIF